MKILLYNLIALFFLINGRNSDLELKMLNSKLHNGDSVLIEFKNNSKYNYCFIIDTNFYSRDVYYNRGKFQNPRVILYDNANNMIGVNVEIKDSGFYNDSINLNNKKTNFLSKKSDTLIVDELKMYSDLHKKGFVNTLNVYKIKSGKSLRLKIPFNLVVKYLKDNVHEYYEIDKSKKYKGRIEYLIKREYIEKYISKDKIDSLEKKGYKFFTGKLVSNKVPLTLK